jgi:tRNA A-37 threonylcarbamoyl transferase component Bud32
MWFRDTIFIETPYEQLLKEAGLDTVQAILDVVGDDVAAWSRTTDTIRVALGGEKNWHGGAFVKRYHYPRWKSRFKAMFRGTFFSKNRARTEYDTLRRMRQLHVPAVRPIAYGERRFLHFVTNCFLITEAVPHSTSLVSFAVAMKENGNGQLVTPHQRRALVRSLADQVRLMHEAGFAHGRLFWRNVILRRFPDDLFEFHFLDAAPGKRIWRKHHDQPDVTDDISALRTVASQFCTRADMCRFAKIYLATDKLTEQHRKWIKRIEALSAQYQVHEEYRLKMSRLFYRHARNLKLAQ